MGFKSSYLLCLGVLLAVSCSIHALDVAKLLEKSPEFASFTKALNETKLIDQINSRNSITILALNDGAMGGLSGKSPQAIKAILSTHVILDYFDEKKLMEAQGSNQLLTTLYQASGLAQNQQGFIKVALVGEGEIAFGSAVKGSPVDVELVKTVVTQPYNISILEVARPITFEGGNAQAPSAPANAKAPAPAESAKAPVSANASKAPAPTQDAVADAPTPGAQTPTSEAATAPTPFEAPVAETPTEGPTAADVSSPSLAPGASDDAAAADAKDPSSSSRTVAGFVGAVMCLASLVAVM
ncbi:unnamed protein product [Lathyrus sativus]|nr:unnamed protein product [Lathyrus sativus]